MKFEVGDAVQLINGHSPIMTVVNNSSFDVYVCTWFDVTSNIRTHAFMGKLLKPCQHNKA